MTALSVVVAVAVAPAPVAVARAVARAVRATPQSCHISPESPTAAVATVDVTRATI